MNQYRNCAQKHLDDWLQFHGIAPRGIYSEFKYTNSATQQILNTRTRNCNLNWELETFANIAFI